MNGTNGIDRWQKRSYRFRTRTEAGKDIIALPAPYFAPLLNCSYYPYKTISRLQNECCVTQGLACYQGYPVCANPFVAVAGVITCNLHHDLTTNPRYSCWSNDT